MTVKKGKARAEMVRIGFICKGCGRSYCTHIGRSAQMPPEGSCFWRTPPKYQKPNWRPLYAMLPEGDKDA